MSSGHRTGTGARGTAPEATILSHGDPKATRDSQDPQETLAGAPAPMAGQGAGTGQGSLLFLSAQQVAGGGDAADRLRGRIRHRRQAPTQTEWRPGGAELAIAGLALLGTPGGHSSSSRLAASGRWEGACTPGSHAPSQGSWGPGGGVQTPEEILVFFLSEWKQRPLVYFLVHCGGWERGWQGAGLTLPARSPLNCPLSALPGLPALPVAPRTPS